LLPCCLNNNNLPASTKNAGCGDWSDDQRPLTCVITARQRGARLPSMEAISRDKDWISRFWAAHRSRPSHSNSQSLALGLLPRAREKKLHHALGLWRSIKSPCFRVYVAPLLDLIYARETNFGFFMIFRFYSVVAALFFSLLLCSVVLSLPTSLTLTFINFPPPPGHRAMFLKIMTTA
jgi:hypothetical protein